MVDTINSIDIGDSKPFKSCPYQKSFVEEQVAAKELNTLLDAGLLKPSKSPWASLLLFIKKKNGVHCTVMDYCKLSSLTTQNSYPLPQIDDTLKKLGGSKFFSAIYLASSYW